MTAAAAVVNPRRHALQSGLNAFALGLGATIAGRSDGSDVAEADSRNRIEAPAPSTPLAAPIEPSFAAQVKGAVIWRSASLSAGAI